jgi:mannose-6-phosphate isomerase-like protein (cupin superfamily)
MQAVSQYNPLSHYVWGNGCAGWNLVDSESLNIKVEKMPSGTSEVKHYHQKAQQFFYILSGTATFEVNEEMLQVKSGEGLHIPAGKKHRISNDSEEDLEFLLCAQPSTANDRINE